MIRSINKKGVKGQAALVLILLTAAGLIFFAITLNWGRVAQSKTMLTIAADQSASLLASDAASYGQMWKSSYMPNHQNFYSSVDWGIIISILAFIAALVITIVSWGTCSFLLVAALAMAAVSLVLQLVVVQPGMVSMWNKLQKNQPIAQQFYEQGIQGALQGTVTDQVNITDFFDSNGNGSFGITNGYPNDINSRFAFFYTDRLKMLNTPPIPQVKFFYSELGEFVNGETCAQNAADNYYSPSVAIIPDCVALDNSAETSQYCMNPAAGNGNYCNDCSSDPACQTNVTNSFQLSNACTPNSDPTSSNYTPYCDPCCQPLTVPDPLYSATTPNPLHPSPDKAVRPASCDQGTDYSGAPVECTQNNPYGSPASLSNPFTLLYDPNYQNYAAGKSFLAKYGRDQQTKATPTLQGSTWPTFQEFFTDLKLQGDFPNGIYPFFWLMKDYNPQVNNIDPMSSPLAANSPALHWCSAATTAVNGVTIPAAAVAPTGFPDLGQLSLGYACQGKDCCVNYLADKIVLNAQGVAIPVNDGTENGTSNGVIDMVGSTFDTTPSPNPALDQSFGEPKPATTSTTTGKATISPTPVWLEGDNQMCVSSGQCDNNSSCSATVPCTDGSNCTYSSYNGATQVFPDGTCEWTDSGSTPYAPNTPWVTVTPSTSTSTQPPPDLAITPTPGTSSVDSLDDVMHTLSDFITFSNTVLNSNPTALSSTLDTWYPQAAQWIAPACTNLDAGRDPFLGNIACTISGDSNCILYNNTCNTGSTPGRLLSIYNTSGNTAPEVDRLSDWNNVITNWLNKTDYDTTGAWCLPPSTTGSAKEDAYITNSSGTTNWGDLPHVIACLNYNSGQMSENGDAIGPVYNYLQCKNALATISSSSKCPSSLSSNTAISAACAPDVLGRSLRAGAVPSTDESTDSGWCHVDSTDTSYADWVSDSYTLANDEAPKFTLRAQYLTDAYTRAKTMQKIFTEGDTALHSFLKPCGGCAEGSCTGGMCSDGSVCGSPKGQCEDGGPAAQLMYARAQTPSAAELPNAVIYGWQDALPSGGSGGCTDNNGTRIGCAHIVKVTAYAPARNGNASFVQSLLPWMHMFISWDIEWYGIIPYLNWEMTNRDGYVYVSVKRWDQDHSNTTKFPNTHPLWKFLFGNPKPKNSVTAANSPPVQGFDMTTCLNSNKIGYGLLPQTITALTIPSGQPGYVGFEGSSTDQTAMSQAFMLNDEGDGKTDPSGNTPGNTCATQSSGYCNCLSMANSLVTTAPESHACAEYVAKAAPVGSSGNGDQGYSLKFVDCNTVDGGNPPPDDLAWQPQS